MSAVITGMVPYDQIDINAPIPAAFASVGDGDGDGREDLLILDPEASPQAFYARGSAMFFSAPTALPLPAPVPASFGVAASP